VDKEQFMSLPVVSHFNTNIFLNSVIKAEDLFSVTDEDGDAILSYFIQDYQSDPTGGFFRLNGVAFANGSQFQIDAADLPDLEYVSGSRIGSEGFRVIARDAAGELSTTADFGRLYTVRDNVTRPFVANRPFDALANESTDVSPFIQAFDADGYPITQYWLRDRNVDDGFLSLDGVPLTQGEYSLVRAEDLSSLTYTTVDGPFSEPLDIFAYDGELWSVRRTFDVTTIQNVNRPVAQFTRGDIEATQLTLDTLPMRDVTNIVDDDGNSIKYFEFLNTSPHLVHGDLLLNGVVQPRKQWIRVAAEDLDDIVYRAPDRDFTQQIRVRGFDGKFVSTIGTISITTDFTFVIPPTQPELATDGLVYDQQLVQNDITSLFRKADNGKAFTRYQFYDANDDLTSGEQLSARFEQNNDRLAARVIHDFTATEVANEVRLRTGDYNNRSIDDIYTRVQNEDGLWSSWSRLQVRTEPEHFNAHDANNSWFNVPGIPLDSQGRLELSYSFMQDFPDYETGSATDDDAPENFTRFNQSQRVSVRSAFDSVERLANIKFIEVSDSSTNVLGQKGGIYRFGNYGQDDDMAQAFAFTPNSAPSAGDIWFNRILLNEPRFTYDPQLPFGGSSYTTLLHEIMHTLGFMHTFEPAAGSGVLPDVTNNDNFSVLSTGSGQRQDGLFPTTPQLYDVETIQTYYGVNTSFNSGDDLYDIAGYWGRDAFVENIWDGGGNDTLSLAGSNPDVGEGFANTIDLSPGGFSTFNGFNENVSLALRAQIENAIGSDIEDTIFGSSIDNVIDGMAGDDVIEGRAGNDTITGGAGADVFLFGVGDGNDVIDENFGAGADTIRLTEFPTLDVLEDDLRFRMDGRDLIIELKLDNSDVVDGQIRVVNQVWGRNRIETLELGGTQIDLRNLTEQITVVDDAFRITEESGAFGNLVVPV
jgi:Ca2+-binding RTX toxin-like protein